MGRGGDGKWEPNKFVPFSNRSDKNGLFPMVFYSPTIVIGLLEIDRAVW